jgi:hypothetical protein
MSRIPKLTDEQVKEIRTMRATDPGHWGYTALAKHFGCGESTIRDIVLGKTRRNVIVFVPESEQIPDRYDIAAKLRQEMLDYINENGPVNNAQIAAHFNLLPGHVFRTTRKMTELGELSRKGAGQASSFTAIKTESTPADVLRSNAYNKRSLNRAESRTWDDRPKRAKTPGRYVHVPGFYNIPGHEQGSPIKNPDGPKFQKAGVGSGMYKAGW